MASYTISPIWGAGAQLFDNNGDPLSGGKIYVYSAGSTTPATTYTDPTGLFANTNPIIADANGRLPDEIWLSVGRAYKFVLKTTDDVLLATYDNVPTLAQPPIVNDASSISFNAGYLVPAGAFTVGSTYQIASVGTTDFISVGASSNTVNTAFVATGPGVGTGTAYYLRTVQAKLRDFVSVEDFGAVGDGVTDDTASIQTALNYGLTSGNTIFGSSNAQYLVSASIIINCDADFSTSTFIVDSSFSSEVIKTSASATGAVLLRDLIIKYPNITNNRTLGSIPVVGSVGILVEGARNCDFTFGNVYGFETGVFLYSSNNLTYTAYNTLTFNGLIAGNTTNLHLKADATGWVNQCVFIGGQFAQFSGDVAVFNITNLKITKSVPGGNNAPNGHTFVGCSMEGAFYRTIQYDFNPAIVTSYFSCNTWLNCRFEAAATFEFSNLALYDQVINSNAFGQATFINDAIPNCFSTRIARYTNDNAPTAGATNFRSDKEIVRFIASNSASAVALAVGSRTHTHGGLAGTGAYQLFNAFNTALEFPVAEINVVGGTPKIAFGTGSASPTTSLLGVGTQLRTAATAFLPNDDNVTNLGAASNRWANVYAGNGTIITSDAREKQQIKNLSDAERVVAIRCKELVRTFKFNHAVEVKGDNARTHVGFIVQDIKKAFEDEGLDPNQYALFCHDLWEEQKEICDPETGVVIQPHIPAGERHGLRTDQLLAFIIAAM